MNKNMIIAIIIGISIIIGVIGYQINETTWVKTSVDEYYEKDGKVAHVVYPENPQILGPLQINKDKFLIGENIFYIVRNLQPMDKGSLHFVTPFDHNYYEVNFDGEESESQKGYFRPQLSKTRGICEKDLLVGEWTVYFKGYENNQLKFTIVDEILPGNEKYYVRCDAPTLVMPENIQP